MHIKDDNINFYVSHHSDYDEPLLTLNNTLLSHLSSCTVIIWKIFWKKHNSTPVWYGISLQAARMQYGVIFNSEQTLYCTAFISLPMSFSWYKNQTKNLFRLEDAMNQKYIFCCLNNILLLIMSAIFYSFLIFHDLDIALFCFNFITTTNSLQFITWLIEGGCLFSAWENGPLFLFLLIVSTTRLW